MSDKDLNININLRRDKVPGQLAEVRDKVRKLNRELLTDEEVNEEAKRKIIARTNRDRIDGAAAAAEAEKRALEETQAAATETARSLASLVTGFVGLGSASAVVSSVAEHFREVNRSIFEAGQFVTNYRKALLELAALKGQMGNTTGALGEDLDFRSKTLQSAEDARSFQMAALGVGESAIDKPGKPALITPAESRRAMELGGAFQAAEGGSADTHGTLIGLIPGLLGRRTSGEEVARKEAQLYNIFKPGGPSFTSLSNQYSKSLAPLVGSKTLDMMKGAALLSAFSTTNKEGAGTEVEQFVRATLGGIDRTGKPRVKGGTPIGDYYASLGVTPDVIKGTKPTDLAFMIADRIGKDLAAQEGAANARGEEFSRNVYLRHKGFANQEDAAALAHYISLSESGQLGTFMDLAAPGAMPTLAQAREPVEKAQRTEPALQSRKAELAAEAARVASGAGMPEFVRNLQGVAFAGLKARGEVSGEYDEGVRNQWSLSPKELLFGARRKTEMESQRLLINEAKRVGVTPPRTTSSVDKAGNVHESYLGDEALYELGRKVVAAGGTATPGLGDVVGAAKGRLGESAAAEAGKAAPPKGLDSPEVVKVLREIRDQGRPRAGAPAPLVPNVRPPAFGR